MRWWLALTLISLVGAGCRAPAPTIDPFAPYGARVIPPPATGAIGSPNGYYQPAPAAIPAPYPGAPAATSQTPLQPIPPVATQPAAPRTSALPNQGNWESAGSGFGYAYPTYPSRTMVAPASATVSAPGLVPSASPAIHQAPLTYASPPIAVTEYHPQPAPFLTATTRQPLPIRPSSIRPSISSGSFVDNACCPPVGDTVFIPRTDPYLTASAPSYSGNAGYYGPVTTAQTAGWRRRR